MRSIELGWIARFDKSLILPELVFSPSDEYGGLYYAPWDKEEVIGDKAVDRRNGIILISTAFPDDIGSNLAHEWRHHWQVLHGWNIEPAFQWNNPSDYDEAIVQYFVASESEADALRFQTKRAGCCEHWRDLLSHAGFEFAI